MAIFGAILRLYYWMSGTASAKAVMETLTPERAFEMIRSHFDLTPPSKTKSNIVSTVARGLSYIWDCEEVAGLSTAKWWKSCSSFLRMLYYAYVGRYFYSFLSWKLTSSISGWFTIGWLVIFVFYLGCFFYFSDTGSREFLYAWRMSANTIRAYTVRLVWTFCLTYTTGGVGLFTWTLIASSILDGVAYLTSQTATDEIANPVEEVGSHVILLWTWLFISLQIVFFAFSTASKWFDLPIDILLWWLGRQGSDEKTIGKLEMGAYMLLSKKFPIEQHKGNHSLVSQKFSGGNLQEYLKATDTNNQKEDTSNATKTGPTLVDADGPQQIYEWKNDESGLKIAVWTRQLLTSLLPDLTVVGDFAKYCAPFLKELAKRVCAIQPPVDIKEEIQNSPAWSAQKKKQYFTNSFATLNRILPWNKKVDKHFYEAMVKVGEKNCVSLQWVYQFIHGLRKLGDRARLIFVPKGEAACGLLTMMQRPLLKTIKSIMPGFCHSMSCTEMTDHIESNLLKLKKGNGDFVALCADGSNHDGHQHMSLIKAVDYTFFNALFKNGWMERTLSKYSYSREATKSVIDVPIYEEVATLKSRFGNHKLNQKIRGTTFSGSPTRTTLGNTLRVFLYWKYICSRAGLTTIDFSDDAKKKDVFVFVSGDDVVMWCRQEVSDKILKSAKNLTSPTKDPQVKGLGQCVEQIHVRPWWDIDFCSKVSFLYQRGEQTKFIILRDPRKVLTHSSYHRFCSETAYLPAALHNEYVAESIDHELPGELMRAYSHNRRRLGRIGLKIPKGVTLSQY